MTYLLAISILILPYPMIYFKEYQSWFEIVQIFSIKNTHTRMLPMKTYVYRHWFLGLGARFLDTERGLSCVIKAQLTTISTHLDNHLPPLMFLLLSFSPRNRNLLGCDDEIGKNMGTRPGLFVQGEKVFLDLDGIKYVILFLAKTAIMQNCTRFFFSKK